MVFGMSTCLCTLYMQFSKGLFRIVIVVMVQSIFRLKCIKIIFFYFLKIIFKISTLKRYENIKNKFLTKKF
jgi:hypothetical protein